MGLISGGQKYQIVEVVKWDINLSQVRNFRAKREILCRSPIGTHGPVKLGTFWGLSEGSRIMGFGVDILGDLRSIFGSDFRSSKIANRGGREMGHKSFASA